MLSTYLNDNQHMAYPFFGNQELPFPNSCITGLGVCLRESRRVEATADLFYISNVIISKNAVWVSICKRVNKDGQDTGQLLGTFYATTEGYYVYIPSYVLDAAYENGDQIVSPEPLRLVYSLYADMSEAEAEALSADMQVFYSRVMQGTGITNTKNKGTGYMFLGTIPENAIGSYTGEFYLDPRCIVYMPENVLGHHRKIIVNNTSMDLSSVLQFNTTGLLGLDRDTETKTLTFKRIQTEDTQAFVNLPNSYKKKVTGINGYQLGGGTLAYPRLELISDVPDITFSVYNNSGDSAVVIEAYGNSRFSSCPVR